MSAGISTGLSRLRGGGAGWGGNPGPAWAGRPSFRPIMPVNYQYESIGPRLQAGYCTTIVIFIELWPRPQ